MEQISARLRKWGNSFGVVIPSDVVARQKLKEGSEVTLNLNSKKKSTGKDLIEFGKKYGLSDHRNVEEVMREIDRELYGIRK
ncbi:MAG: AbrB/MazE/SpoVT family DNA-binding domain-containing protein [archaeon]